MAFTATVTDDARIQNALRLRYINTPPQELLFNEQSDPFMKLVQDEQDNKNPGAGFVVQWVSRNGVGPNPLWAEAGKNAEAYSKLTVSACDFNWRAKWTRNAMIDAEAEGSAGVYNLAKSKIDREIKYTQLSITNLLEQDGWGTLAYIANNDGNFVFYTSKAASETTTVTKQLTNRFFVNQRLCIAALPSSGTLLGSTPGTIFTVTDVDPTTGKVTVDTDLSTATVADGYAVSEYGFRPYNASSGVSTLLGLNYWLPLSVITDNTDPRYGIPSLQPLRFTPDGSPTLKGYLLQMAEFAFTQRLDMGTKKPIMLVSPKDHRDLAIAIESTRIVVQRLKDNGETYEVGIPSVTIQGGMGDIPVVASAGMTPGTVRYGCFDEHFRFMYSGKKLINVLDNDGRVYRVANESGITDNNGVAQSGFNAEGYSRIQLICKQPGSFVTGTGFNA